MKSVLALFVILILSGCGSNKYPITYVSEPPNAAVICNGQTKGYAPLTLYYDIDREKNPHTFRTQSCHAMWASGTSERFGSEIPLTQYPNGVTATARRSSNAPNYSIDAQAAMQGAQQREIERQRQNQEMQAIQQQLRNIGRTTSTNCYRAGDQVFCNSY